jgi:hypothetical protein
MIGSAHNELVVKEEKPGNDTVPGGDEIFFCFSARIDVDIVEDCHDPGK